MFYKPTSYSENMTQRRLRSLIRVPMLVILMALLALPALAAPSGVTPDDFAIGKLFKKYARHRKVTFVNLKGNALKDKAIYGIDSLTHVAILQISEPTKEFVQDMEKTIETDKSIADDIQEVFAQGYLISAAYRLHQEEGESVYLVYRYVFDDNHIIVSYLQGNVSNKAIAKLVNRKSSDRRKVTRLPKRKH